VTDVVTDKRFAATWPAVSKRLLRLLRNLGVDPGRGEDFVQEAALRVLRDRIPYDDDSDLYRWASVVVRRLVIDAWRRERILTDDSTLLDRASLIDVEHEVERRIALEAVLRQWPNLTNKARHAIIQAVEEQSVEIDESYGQRAARYRARQALRRASKGLLAGLGLGRVRRGSRSATASLVPVVAVGALLGPVIGALRDASPDAPSRRAAAPARSSTIHEVEPVAVSVSHSPQMADRQSQAPSAAPRTPSRRTQTIVEASPAGIVIGAKRDPGATGPLVCASPALPPLPESLCAPRIGDLLPTPAPTPGF